MRVRYIEIKPVQGHLSHFNPREKIKQNDIHQNTLNVSTQNVLHFYIELFVCVLLSKIVYCLNLGTKRIMFETQIEQEK